MTAFAAGRGVKPPVNGSEAPESTQTRNSYHSEYERASRTGIRDRSGLERDNYYVYRSYRPELRRRTRQGAGSSHSATVPSVDMRSPRYPLSSYPHRRIYSPQAATHQTFSGPYSAGNIVH